MRFLHTADWQLGMTRRFFHEPGAQERYTAARLDAVRAIGRVAAEQNCEFAMVCGDVYETNRVSSKTIRQGLEAMREIGVPLYLVPGNHDPYEAASVYLSPEFVAGRPDHVHVLDKPGVHRVRDGVEIVAAPWTSKHPLTDLVNSACADLDVAPGIRVVAGHGALDKVTPQASGAGVIAYAPLAASLDAGKIHYVGLGDRHSVTEAHERIWYSGTQEVTDFTEDAPGEVLVVEIDDDNPRGAIKVERHRVGTWRFELVQRYLDGPHALDDLAAYLNGLTAKDRTVVKLAATGTLSVLGKARYDEIVASARELFVAVTESKSRSELAVLPEDDDFSELGLSGFAASALTSLRDMSAEDPVARDALALLVRLAGRSA